MNFIYLLILVIYILGCSLFGYLLICSLFRRETLLSINWYAIIASAFLMGQAIIANIWLIMGITGIFSPVLVAILFTGIAGGSFFIIKSKPTGQLTQINSSINSFRSLPWIWKGVSLILVIVLVNFGFIAIVEAPAGDAAAFYMVLPKIMAASHKLIPPPNYYSFTQIGLSAEMHFAALMSLASPHVAKLFIWFTAIALSGMLVAINTTIGNSKFGKIVTLVLLFSSTAFTFLIPNGKVDLIGCAFGLAAYYWAIQIERIPGKAPYILTGLFTGFAIIAKLSNTPVIVPGILILIVWNNFTKKVSLKERYINTTKWLGIFGMIVILTMIPHLLKNYVLFGEPFAPFLFLKSVGNNWLQQSWFSKETTKFIIKTYPVALLYGQSAMQGGNISFLLLAFLPLLFVLPKNANFKPTPFRQLSIIALVGLVLWIVTSPAVLAPRYILATLLLFIPLAANGIERLFSEQTNHLKLLRGTVLFSMLFVAVSMLLLKGNLNNNIKEFTKYAFSSQSEYSPGNTFKVINRLVQPGERVFFVGYYSYYFSAEVLQCMNGTDGKNVNSADWEELFKNGFKYLLIDKRSHGSSVAAVRIENAPSWISVKKIFDDDAAILYSISSLDPNKKPLFICKQVHPPSWEVIKSK